MRAAICFFGITRNLQPRTLRSLRKNVLDPIAEVDPRFLRFGHFNVLPRIDNPRSGEAGSVLRPGDHTLLGCDRVETTPQEEIDRTIDLTPFLPYGDAWTDGFRSTKNLLSQYHSLRQVTRLLQESGEKPDLVVYARPDLFYSRRLEIPVVRPRTIYTPSFQKWGGLNDRFALGDLPTMLLYGERGDWAERYVTETKKPLHAESLLEWLVRRQGLANVDLSLYFRRVRANGNVAPLDGRLRRLYLLADSAHSAFARLRRAADDLRREAAARLGR